MACLRLIPRSSLSRWTLLFALLNLVFLLCGVFVLVVSIGWYGLMDQSFAAALDKGHLWIRMALSYGILNGGFAFSAASVVTAVLSLWTICTRPTQASSHSKPVLIYLGFLFLVVLGTVSLGTIIWFLTLRERSLFTPLWSRLPLPLQLSIQDTLSCCGWLDATPSGLFLPPLAQGFCADVATVPRNPDPNVTLGCVGPVVKKMDFILNNIFTTIYGFLAVQILLLLSAATIAQLRQQERRFLQIDSKHVGLGKGGFV